MRRFINRFLSIAIVLLIGYIFTKNKIHFSFAGKSQDVCNTMLENYFSKNYLAGVGEDDEDIGNESVETFVFPQEDEGNYFMGEDHFAGEQTSGVITDNKNDVSHNLSMIEYLNKTMDYEYLKSNFFLIDSTTSVNKDILNPKKLLGNDVTIKKDSDVPQILIYHTHSTEHYIDSRDGVQEDTVVGVGEYLAQLLRDKGYNVIHDTSTYDVVDGKWNRKAYDTAYTGLEKVLEENPDIQVVIDLHRNAGAKKEVTEIDGKKTAQIMFFNGVSRTRTGSRSYLSNDNLEMNLSFSLQMLIETMRSYEDLARHIYVKGYRYNLHLRARSMLVEVGNDKNTVEEAMNAMEPLSAVIDRVLTGKGDL